MRELNTSLKSSAVGISNKRTSFLLTAVPEMMRKRVFLFFVEALVATVCRPGTELAEKFVAIFTMRTSGTAELTLHHNKFKWATSCIINEQ